MIRQLIKYSISNMWERKVRSFLTILSILVGITAIFALVSFGQGINIYMKDMAQKQGTDKLIIQAKGSFGGTGTNVKFTDGDIDFINKIRGVDVASGAIVDTTKVKFKDSKDRYVYYISLPVSGKEKKLGEEIMTLEISEGRGLKEGDVLKAVLGHNYMVPNKIFKKAVSVGDNIELNDVKVGVVGFYDEVGNPQDDSQIYLTKEGVKQIYGKEDYGMLFMRASPGVDPSALSERITERFRKHRGQEKGEEDFYVQTFEQVIKTFTSIISILNGILILIALISVVVASVNIMNTMYTSVLDRTREIGVMKAIGAQNKMILMIFVLESAILGTIGGVFGVIFGYLIAKAGAYIAAINGLSMLRPAFPIWLTMGCLVFSFIVGAGSGLLPSLQASRLSPVEALRYE